MCAVATKKTELTVRAYAGDAKTLLAFNLPSREGAKRLAGFTICCAPPGIEPYYLQNVLQFETPAHHAQDPTEPANSSINAPIHKFRWLHVPGSVHQGIDPVMGKYKYIVTPRFFDDSQSMLPLDPSLSASVSIDVAPFRKGKLEIGFTRGFTQSQAFTRHFGKDALIRPDTDELLFDTSVVSGTEANGTTYTFDDEYDWLGFSARQRIFEILEDVEKNKALMIDVFAYDLNEPNMIRLLLKLAKQGRVRIILDNAALHHSTSDPKPEDAVEKLFAKAAKAPAEMMRGKFGRYAHDKVLIVRRKANGAAVKVLTGSTNFSVTGLYVNSNHVLVYSDATVAGKYAALFDSIWENGITKASYLKTPFASETFASSGKSVPSTEITFAPHSGDFTKQILDGVVARIEREGKKAKASSSVIFAVMAIDKGSSPVYDALKTLHADERIFSFGISDNPGGIALYSPGRKTGVLVTGKPVNTQLPPPFSQVRNIGGVGHQVHHKFVVCGFNGDDPTVYCGSSNLASGGEENNGDNLLVIRDADVATAFMIEGISLVDHFQFLDRTAKGPKSKKSKTPPRSKQQAALSAGWFLGTSDKWAEPYFDPKDLHFTDRMLFGSP